MSAEGEEFSPLDADRPQLDGLDRDLIAFHPLWDEAMPLLQASVDRGGNPRIALIEVLQDSYWRAYEHAVGAAMLLHDERAIPFLAVLRALYETMITLNYLATHEDPEREAQIALAHQPMHEFWMYKTYGLLEEDLPRMNDAKRRMTEHSTRFDPGILAEARARRTRYRWTNKSFKELVDKRGDPHEYRFVYGRMSAVVHPDQRQIALRAGNLSPQWYELRTSETRYCLREVRRLMVRVLGLPFPSRWLDDPAFTPA